MIASRRWQDWAITLIGALVALSPFVLISNWTANEAWTAYILGGLIFVVGALSLIVQRATYFEWTQVILALALFAAPWVIGFTGVTAMAWTAWIGAVAVVLVLATLLVVERPTAARAA